MQGEEQSRNPRPTCRRTGEDSGFRLPEQLRDLLGVRATSGSHFAECVSLYTGRNGRKWKNDGELKGSLGSPEMRG